MNIHHDSLFSVYAGYNAAEGLPGPDDESSGDSASDGRQSDHDDSEEPAPPYAHQNTTPTPFIIDYSFLNRSGQNLRVPWGPNTRYGGAPIPSGSAAASSRVAPSEALLGPLTSSGVYYSLSIMFKPVKVCKLHIYSHTTAHRCWRVSSAHCCSIRPSICTCLRFRTRQLCLPHIRRPGWPQEPRPSLISEARCDNFFSSKDTVAYYIIRTA